MRNKWKQLGGHENGWQCVAQRYGWSRSGCAQQLSWRASNPTTARQLHTCGRQCGLHSNHYDNGNVKQTQRCQRATTTLPAVDRCLFATAAAAAAAAAGLTRIMSYHPATATGIRLAGGPQHWLTVAFSHPPQHGVPDCASIARTLGYYDRGSGHGSFFCRPSTTTKPLHPLIDRVTACSLHADICLHSTLGRFRSFASYQLPTGILLRNFIMRTAIH